jgi:DHA1 family tetracycline resistance protein-like MFS transporter
LILLRSHRELSGLAITNFLVNLAHVVFPTVFVLFAGYRFGWDESAVGLTMALYGLASMIVQAGLVGPVVAWLGESRALLVGLLFGVAGMTIFGLATNGIAFCIGIPVIALEGFAGPATQGLMTRRVSPTEQGQLQGANNSIVGIANLVGPAIFALTFAYAIHTGRGVDLVGAPFLLAALMLLASAGVAWRAARVH